MASEQSEPRPWRCVFCRMHTGVRLLRVPLCAICRDQVHDFVWVSGIQGTLAVAGVIGGLQFAVEEVLLFAVLVVIKHRLPSILDRFTENA